MSDFLFAWNKSGKGSPDVREVLIGKSTEIHAGDVLVLTTSSNFTANNIPVVRPYLSGDTLTTSNGVIGVALFDVETDASAVLTSVSSPVTVDASARAQRAFGSIAYGLPTDPDTGYHRLYIAAANVQNVFAALTQSSDVADFYLIGRAVGIAASAATAPADYTVNDDAAGANAPIVVERVDTLHAQYNSAGGGGRVFVSFRNTFDQFQTGTFHTT